MATAFAASSASADLAVELDPLRSPWRSGLIGHSAPSASMIQESCTQLDRVTIKLSLLPASAAGAIATGLSRAIRRPQHPDPAPSLPRHSSRFQAVDALSTATVDPAYTASHCKSAVAGRDAKY